MVQRERSKISAESITTAFAEAVFSAASRLAIIVPSIFRPLLTALTAKAGINEENTGEQTQNVPARAESADITLFSMIPAATAAIAEATPAAIRSDLISLGLS